MRRQMCALTFSEQVLSFDWSLHLEAIRLAQGVSDMLRWEDGPSLCRLH